jgi:predicted RNA binding protein YcfA (HicA-like mRNA interferase family)
MRLPRDVSGAQLGRALGKLGYVLARQKGSHLRYTTQHAEHTTSPFPTIARSRRGHFMAF